MAGNSEIGGGLVAPAGGVRDGWGQGAAVHCRSSASAGMRDLTARTAPPGTLAPDGRLREVRTAADRLDIAVAHFEAALTEVPDMLATYAGLVRNGSQQVSLTRAESRALRMMLAHALAEVRTLDHLALVRHRDAAARDDAGHALLAELEARVAALEARLGTGGA